MDYEIYQKKKKIMKQLKKGEKKKIERTFSKMSINFIFLTKF